MKLHQLFPVLCLFVLAVPMVVAADTVVRSGESVSIATDQIVAGDFYTAAGDVNISGEVTKDMVVAGGRVVVNGAIGEDFTALGGTIDLHGRVGEDVRIVAGEVVLADEVVGNILVIAGSLDMLSTASVTGNIVFYGGQGTIAGSVGGDILGYNGELRIDGSVGGKVEVTTSQLTLGERATVAGNVQYTSQNEIVRAQNATVTGEVSRNDRLIEREDSRDGGSLLPILALLFTALAIYLMARRRFVALVTMASDNPLRAVLFGLAALFVSPFIIVILLASLVGALLGGILLLLYALFFLLALVLLFPILGAVVMRLAGKTQAITPWTIIVGAAAGWLLLLIPYLGEAVLFACLVMALGVIVESFSNTIRR